MSMGNCSCWEIILVSIGRSSCVWERILMQIGGSSSGWDSIPVLMVIVHKRGSQCGP